MSRDVSHCCSGFAPVRCEHPGPPISSEASSCAAPRFFSSLADGDATTGIDLTIRTTGFGGGGGCGGSAGSTADISGVVLITVNYASGDVASMLVNTDGVGPFHSTTETPTATATGAEAAYSFTSCANYGQMRLVGDQDLTGYDVEIPLGDESGVRVVPFVQLSGAVSMADNSTLDSLPAGSNVYVAALKYRPNTSFDITNSAAVYDVAEFSYADIPGQQSVSYDLIVPADTVVYLWAYADTDVDGQVNESGELVASGCSDDNGRLETTGSSTGNDLPLATAGN